MEEEITSKGAQTCVFSFVSLENIIFAVSKKIVRDEDKQ